MALLGGGYRACSRRIELEVLGYVTNKKELKLTATSHNERHQNCGGHDIRQIAMNFESKRICKKRREQEGQECTGRAVSNYDILKKVATAPMFYHINQGICCYGGRPFR